MSTKPEQKESFIKTLAIAFALAMFVRSFFFEPFHIPSSSMKPGLLIGDYIFVSKFSYGYSRYSFPLGLKIFEGRIWKSTPKRGDVAVFRLPENPRINYIKRIIGLPGDTIQVRDGVLFINEEEIPKEENGLFEEEGFKTIKTFIETLPNNKEFYVLDERTTPQDSTGIYQVPTGHYFMMGDNRDNSQDSRFLDHVGYVPEENLIGRANIIFFSNAKPTWQIWNWPTSIRFSRIFTTIK
ncbi:MAG: signal peptidase I [Rickettsiales bacterium]|nr:signal peptidase I [Rickettsiales bacterium]